MRIQLCAAVFAAVAALLLSSAPAAHAKSDHAKSAHKSMKAHTQHTRAPRHVSRRAAPARVSTYRTARPAPTGDVPPGARRGFMPGIGEVFYGGPEGPPNGGAYTLRPTGDPSVGYFPALWAAQRRGDCVSDDGYGRFSACGDGR
jgi:hypothetical protein